MDYNQEDRVDERFKFIRCPNNDSLDLLRHEPQKTTNNYYIESITLQYCRYKNRIIYTNKLKLHVGVKQVKVGWVSIYYEFIWSIDESIVSGIAVKNESNHNFLPRIVYRHGSSVYDHS